MTTSPSSKANYFLLYVYFFILLTTTNFFQIINADGIFEVNLIPKCKGKSPCTTYFKVCLRHYEKTVNYDDGCSFGETTVSPNEYDKIHQIKLNFSWPRDFSLIVEGFNSERYAAKDRILRQAFQEALEVHSDWIERSIRFNSTQLTTKMRVLCDSNFYGKDCGQRCVPRDNKYGHYECNDKGRKCLPGWRGDFCDVPVCADGCLNGSCKSPGTCECAEGYEGALCDKCKLFPGCQHGSCKKPWECNCDEGWGGNFCDKDLNYCTHHHPCANGLCYNRGDRTYTCECIMGYTGINCDIPVNDCSDSPCMNGGTCSQSTLTTNYTCTCPFGFTGVNCENRISSQCDWKPCENGGTCSNGPSGYLCICPPGYAGPNCEIRVTSCNQSPCLNGATCSSSSTSSYSCNCRAGFNGTHCELNINDCTSDVDLCFNGGTCIDGDNSYTCSCAPGFTGPSCQTNIDDCNSNPCLNNGQCTDLINGFSCKCEPGFSGIDCSYSILAETIVGPPPSSCIPGYCLNGAECKVIPYIASSSLSLSSTITTSIATCSCRPGFSGQRCENIPGVLARSEKSLPESTKLPTDSVTQLTTIPTLTTTTTVPSPKQLIVHFTTPIPAPVSSFSSFERIITTSEMTLISLLAIIIPLVLVCLISYRFSKRRIRREERQRYENEEAIRQNEENSSKKCLQNDSCLIYNDLNRDSMRIINGGQHHHHHHPAALSLSHPHLHPSLLSPSQQPNTILATVSPQCTSSSLLSPSLSTKSSSSCNKKLSNNDDYIVNELTIDPNLTIYGLTPPPTLPPLTLTTDPSGISTTTSHSCHPSPVYTKYATLTSHHHLHPHLHQGGSVVDLHYLHHIVT
ncbi:delta-like protein B [Panonychus citri]|uniref:delta-like protein B n=1 Tax=Panonychus citri TaxID=50023 RepID=UPI002306F3A5|nr:delta-like protein B [Panonychus citri]